MERLQKLGLQLTTERINDNLFSHVTMAPPDPILGTAIAFKNDKSNDKINLGIGAYRDGDGKPYIFNIVKKVEEEIFKSGANKVNLIFTIRNICPSMVSLNSALEPETFCSEPIVQPLKKIESPPVKPYQELAL